MKLIPRCVINRLSQTRIFHHIFNPQIDRSSQVVGRSLGTVQILLHDAIRLPTYFEVASPENLSSLTSVVWTFNPPRHAPVRTFEDFFTLTQESRILNHYPVWVCLTLPGLQARGFLDQSVELISVLLPSKSRDRSVPKRWFRCAPPYLNWYLPASIL